MMAPSRLRAALASGGPVLGHMVMEFTGPNIGAVLAPLGLDFVLLDMEHTGVTLETLAPVLVSCRLAGLDTVVRVPSLDGHFIPRALDLGAMGIMLPNVRDAAEAREFVAAAKYPPAGRRDMGLGGAHTLYRAADPEEYVAWANRETVLMAQIECPEAVADINGILSVPGINVGWVGQYDLTLNMGICGQFDSQEFCDARSAVVEACRRHGLLAGCQPGDVASAQEWFDVGYRVLSLGTDIGAYQRGVGQFLSAVRGFS